MESPWGFRRNHPESPGITRNPSGIPMKTTMESPWNHLGIIWNPHGITMESPWNHLESPRNPSGIPMNIFGILIESPWNHLESPWKPMEPYGITRNSKGGPMRNADLTNPMEQPSFARPQWCCSSHNGLARESCCRGGLNQDANRVNHCRRPTD